jgi:hypothetical protein
MWLFITRRLRTWLIFALVVPIATTVVHLIREMIEKRTGNTRLTRALTAIEDVGRSRSRRRGR